MLNPEADHIMLTGSNFMEVSRKSGFGIDQLRKWYNEGLDDNTPVFIRISNTG